MNDLEQLKKQWQNLKPEPAESDLNSCIPTSRLRRSATALGRLRRLYTVISVIGALWIGLTIPVFNALNLPISLSITTTALFALLTALNLLLLTKINRLNLYSLNCVESLRRVLEISRFRSIMKLIGILVSAPVIAWMLWCFRSYSEPLFYGGITGLVIGLIIGLRNNYLSRRWLRTLRENC